MNRLTEWWHWVRLACLTWWSRGLRWWFGAGKLAGRLAFVSPDGTPGCSGELCTLPVSEFSSSACTETADLKLPPRGVKFCQITTPKTWYSIILALPHGPQIQGLGDKVTIILIIFWGYHSIMLKLKSDVVVGLHQQLRVDNMMPQLHPTWFGAEHLDHGFRCLNLIWLNNGKKNMTT
mgnify:CR=1 FL=1